MKFLTFLTTSVLLTCVLVSCSAPRNSTQSLVGTYYGYLPCADCPGISYTLDLQDDAEYSLIRQYSDRDKTSTIEGKFEYVNEKLILYDDGKVIERYAPDGNRLVYLDLHGDSIKSNLAPYYSLYRGDTSHLKKPKDFNTENSTLVYKGTGNEPFWLIKITSNNTIKFEGLVNGEQKFEVPVTNTWFSDDNQFIGYSGEDQTHSLEVRIINKPCQDDMSGHFNHSTLEVTWIADSKNQKLMGCGNFQNKYRLNGIWHLESINNKGFDAPSIPSLGIYLPDGRIVGSAGCNRFFGSVSGFTNQSVEFAKVGSTKMSCSDMNVEDHYLRLLNQDDIEWKIDEEGRLHLSSSNEGNFIFTRAIDL